MESVASSYRALTSAYVEACGTVEFLHPDDVGFVLANLGVDGPVLDLGCGPGHFTKVLVDAGLDARGIDLVDTFVAHAQATYPDVAYTQGTLHALPHESASVAGALAWYSLIHEPPETLPLIVGEIARVLRPSAPLVVGFFDGEVCEPFAHKVTTAYRWPPAELSAIFAAAGFTEVARTGRPATATARSHAALAFRR
ncbi:class I SAM-dependent methyltransferase [Nocardia camponoti]|uniref:Methyltransferase n=1 Tax=Nocardia camponoti TaxID=1616106 RepID=A0A917QFF5_9NOCA|nr:class I SAM-dependent methyltransferase [Nocardia camponoti]GGK47827.1 methyltransferase [Nocardia camponoti]